MGMFDYVNYKMNCPKCGHPITSFQSKDGVCALLTVQFWEVSNFYSDCCKCGAWVEFTRKAPLTGIDDYDMEVTSAEGIKL